MIRFVFDFIFYDLFLIDSVLSDVRKETVKYLTVSFSLYMMDIILPNHVRINNVSVFVLDLYECDLLIGMDIIRFGDFSVTNHSGQTQFSFRIPSIKHVDFVAEEKP